MIFKPSDKQQAVFDFVATGTGSAIVIAVAGSGKSTTIVRAMPYVPPECSVLVLGFNTSTTADMGRKLDELREETGTALRNVTAKTFHSLGLGAVLKKLGLRYNQLPKPDGGKVRRIARAALNEGDYELYGDFACRLVGLAKGEGIGVLTPDVPAAWLGLIQHHDLYIDSGEADERRAVEIARDLLQRSNVQATAPHHIIDFDDMLYLPLLWRCRLWPNDFVFVDECQDTNPVRRAIAKLALRPGGRLIAVGDPCQAIYGFTGASHDALDLIRAEFNCCELPLTVSYRCPKAAAAMVQPIVPYFEVYEGNIEGEVCEGSVKDMVARFGPHDAVLCRNTAPLVALAFSLIAQGVGCKVLGKEIGAQLVGLIKRMNARGINNLVAKLNHWRDREVARFTACGEEAKAEGVEDRCACIVTVIESLGENERTVPALITRLEGLFSDTNGQLTLSTMHKAKGREWPKVAIYRPDLVPSKWARQEHQYKQELNLLYVARTRFMETLMVVHGREEN